MKKENQSGFTLIEVVISVVIFIVFATGAYQGYAATYSAVASTHHKAVAVDLANARFELVKNMPYSKVGVVGGNPVGVIPATQVVLIDNLSFTVSTTVRNVDDPFDGVSGAGDVFPNDYKLVEISISCAGCKNFPPIVITGRVAPKNLES